MKALQENFDPPLAVICNHPECRGKGAYSMPGRCGNCGATYVLTITKGHEAPSAYSSTVECPKCGCRKVAAIYPQSSNSTSEPK